MSGVYIAGTGSYLPEKVLTNRDLELLVDTSDEWIISRTGIKERRVADASQATSDLCFQASLRALKDARIEPEEIDLILVATITPDYLFPSTACILQAKLGAKKAAAMDISAACSGFMYGLITGAQFISNGVYENVLVVGGETMSRIMDMQDRNTCILFGDGAGAAVLKSCEPGQGILSFDLGSDGTGGRFLNQPAGGSRIPTSTQSIEDRLHYLKMTGSEVFKFAVRVMADSIATATEKAGLKSSDVNLFIPHQANIRILETSALKLGVSLSRFMINLDRYGNMSAASIPVALDEAIKEGKIKCGDIIVMSGFGAGLTWGSCAIKWK